MAIEQQVEVLKRGVADWKQWRQDNPKATIDLSGADLAGADLGGANLHAADLRGARLAEADFSDANQEHSDLSGADLRDAILVQANLKGANVSRANLRDADLTHANIRGANFSGADVGGADLHRVHHDDRTVWPPLPRAAVLQYLYLLRVPILTGVALFALPIVSLYLLPALLGNLFVVDRLNIFWTMVATVTLAFSILVTFRVVLLNGMQRFGVQQALTKDEIPTWALVFSQVLALPMLFVMVCSNGQVPDVTTFLTRLGAGLLGVVVANLGGYVVLLVAVLVSQHYRGGLPADERYPFLFSWMKKLLVRAENHDLVSKEQRDKLGEWGKGGSHAFRAGYFDPDTGLLYPGHWLSFVALAATILLYLWIGHLKHAHLGEAYGIPAICFVVQLLVLLTWILAMAAFFLDRYRIPLLVPMVLLIWTGNITPQSDHYYQTMKADQSPGASPQQVLTAPSRTGSDAHRRGRIVVVATEGGGIQAAAWTAEVLTGLQQEVHGISPDKPINFANSIALISGVSGGAVGTMFFVNAYQNIPGSPGFNVPDNKLPEIVAQAEEPALDDVAWALAYPDFWRVFFPYTKSGEDRLIDRGLALEQRWSKRGDVHDNLDGWRQDVLAGWRPAVIFNSTFVETGEPFLLATSDIPTVPNVSPQRQIFSALAPNADIPVVTAVRLAATFPYVTPASRDINTSGKLPDHVVDGGYYDNYGVYSMLDWLRTALTATPEKSRPDVLIIQIVSFPFDKSEQGKSEGWFYQAYAPVDALLKIRSTAQLVRDRDALGVFTNDWTDKGFRLCQTTFQFDGPHPPLSWQMNTAQKDNIKSDWGSPKKDAGRATVAAFFSGGKDPNCQ